MFSTNIFLQTRHTMIKVYFLKISFTCQTDNQIVCIFNKLFLFNNAVVLFTTAITIFVYKLALYSCHDIYIKIVLYCAKKELKWIIKQINKMYLENKSCSRFRLTESENNTKLLNNVFVSLKKVIKSYFRSTTNTDVTLKYVV